MSQDSEFREALGFVRDWGYVHKKEFYQHFPETVQQEAVYDFLGFRQHGEVEEFASDLEQDLEEKDERHLRKQLQSELDHLSDTAAREAASLQNITVYNHAIELWREAEDTDQLLAYLEKYAEKRLDWDERNILDKTDEELLQEPRLDYGDEEDTEYIEEILTHLVTETMHEV